MIADLVQRELKDVLTMCAGNGAAGEIDSLTEPAGEHGVVGPIDSDRDDPTTVRAQLSAVWAHMPRKFDDIASTGFGQDGDRESRAVDFATVRGSQFSHPSFRAAQAIAELRAALEGWRR